MTEFQYLETSFSEPVNFEEESNYFLKRDHRIPVKPGDKLPNGAIILMEEVVRKFPHRRDSIVLAVTSGTQPFVTWVRTITSDNPERNEDGSHNSWYNLRDVCENGWYKFELPDAIADFNKRVERIKEMV